MLRSSPTLPQTTNNLLGLNIDGQRVLLVYGSVSGRVYESLSFTPPADEPFQSLLEAVSTTADRLLSVTQAQRLPLPDKLSVAISGNYDEDTGILESSADFPLWRSVPLRSQLALRFNLPTVVAKKADAGVMGESLFGDGKDVRNLAFLSLETSVRCGFLTNGMLYRNLGGTSGDIGSMLIDAGDQAASLNTYASPTGIVALAKQRFPQHWSEEARLPEMIAAANQNDPYARELFDAVAEKIAQGIAPIAHILRPELIVIGLPLCQLDSWMLTAIRSALVEKTRLNELKLPKVAFSGLCHRLPELQALSPAIFAARNVKV